MTIRRPTSDGMTPAHAVTLIGVIRTYCPRQEFLRDSPAAWALELCDVRLTDAVDAVRSLAGEVEFMPVHVIRERVTKIRNARIAHHGYPVPPPGLTQSEERIWMRDALRRIGNGETVPDTRLVGAVSGRTVQALQAQQARTSHPIRQETR